MVSIEDIPDNLPLYKIKKYRHALERINDNVPLKLVKRRLHASHIIEFAESIRKDENKKINRKCAIIDSELQKRAFKVMVIDPKSDKICEKCQYYPNHHPFGCNLD